MVDQHSDDDVAATPEFRTLGGRAVVLGILTFGVLVVTAMALYWEFYTRPFRPLQQAIHAEFPDSSPQVVGGRHKSQQRDSPSVLRIVVRVDFDPETADEQMMARQATRLEELAASTMDLSPYDELEIHLVQRVPERETRQREFRVPLPLTE